MKKVISLILVLALCLPLCACGSKVQYKINDTVSTGAVEVKLTRVSYEKEYRVPGERYTVTPKSGYSFIIIEYSLKNVSKSNFTYFPVPISQGTLIDSPWGIVSIDYNNGYTFQVGEVEGTTGAFSESDFCRGYPSHLSELKPLGDATTYAVVVCVPNEVVEKTAAPLLVKFHLIKPHGGSEVVTYNIR